MKIKTTTLTLVAAFAGTIIVGSAGAVTINPSADSPSRTADVFTSPTAANTGDLAVGPVSGSADYFRTHLAFDLTSETVASDVTLTLKGSGSGFTGNENNTTASTQTFTLYALASNWNGALSNPSGTDIASTVLNVTIGNDTQDLVLISTALKDAFNAALGGTLYMGIRSSGESLASGTRSFKWFGSVEDTNAKPELTYTPVPEPTSLALLGLGGLLIARRRRG